MKMAMTWQFPETIFARTNSPEKQIRHFLSEAEEVETASDEEVEMEMADAYHSAESYLRILARKKGEAYVVDLLDRVEVKNRVRGYYGEEFNDSKAPPVDG